MGNNLLDSSRHLGQDYGEASDSDPFGYRRLHLVIRGFFDDSGKESDLDNRIVCISGYLAVDQMWNMFNEGWRHRLLRYGVSWLHMKDFMHDQGEYSQLGLKDDWPKKRAIIEDFIYVIRASNLIGFGVAVDANTWRTIPKSVTQEYGTAQEFCFQRIMRMVAERVKISAPRDVVAITFDCDINFTPARFKRFLAVRQQNPSANEIFQSFSISEPKVFLPLQAADLLAWQTRKELMRKLQGYESKPEFNFWAPDYVSEMWDQSEIEEKIIKPFKEANEKP